MELLSVVWIRQRINQEVNATGSTKIKRQILSVRQDDGKGDTIPGGGQEMELQGMLGPALTYWASNALRSWFCHDSPNMPDHGIELYPWSSKKLPQLTHLVYNSRMRCPHRLIDC